MMAWLLCGSSGFALGATNLATVPVPQPGMEERHEQKVALARQHRYDILMIGDSITHELENPTFENVWQQFYAPRNTLNLGYAGARTENILWNLTHGELDNQAPKVVTLLIGTNNADDANYPIVHSAEKIAEGTAAIVQLLRKKLPEAKILLLRIFPRANVYQNADGSERGSAEKRAATDLRAGELVQSLADGQHVFYLDINAIFRRPDGSIDPLLMPDLLHPSPAGAMAWARAMEPQLTQLLGYALTPPMGWNSWNRFRCDVSEKLVRETADSMVSSGMKDAGYEYIVIDDCWQVSRDEHGRIQADPERFPSGMKALADHVHSKGLKFGLYSDAGSQTCAGRPGSQGHEFQDAMQYAEWGVDYLKYDWCNTGKRDTLEAYTLMSDALRASGRPILFSLCEWGSTKPWLWGKDVGHLWRTAGDIGDSWDVSDKVNGGLGVMTVLDSQVGLEAFSGPGHWNDPDMLVVGLGGLSEMEYRAHFSLWAMLAAPLIAGNDLRKMDEATKEILLNKEIIAIDQDPLGRQASRVAKIGDREVWARPLASGGRAVLFLNRGQTATDISIDWPTLGYPAHLRAQVHNLWTHQALPPATGRITASVKPHEAVVYRIEP
jgi:alpha-galactosidase